METPNEEQPAPKRRRTRRSTAASAVDTSQVEGTEPVADSVEPAADSSEPGAAEEPIAERAPARRGRRGGTGRGRGTRTGAEPETPAETETAAPEAIAGAPAEQAPTTEGEASTPEAASETPEGAEGEGAPQRSRRTRGSRGGAGRRNRGVAAPPTGIAAARAEVDRRTEVPNTPRPRRDAPSSRDSVRSVAPPREGARSGSPIESQIARQNVLFEEFAQQQSQVLRDVQRIVRGIGGAQTTSGSSLALPKVAIFFDVPNLIYAAEAMGVRVDFGKLLEYLTEGRQLVRATAYAPITDDPTTRFEAQRFVAPVVHHGYKIVTKPWKRFADGSMKANFDIELAVDILTMSDRLDIVVLLSGDGDFRRVCELVESKGVRVEVVAFAQSTAMELRSVADHYTDLASILNIVGA
ncbi:MAG TPA: NYN domain-containing protein [Dehalococcoidia bacterium]|nr:NYN domain-containing protein [Dehalococcoidia bacterium]